MKNIYITWHYTTHGIAYFKHILSHFFLQKEIPTKLEYTGLDQVELNETFSKMKGKDGFLFDKIFYLTAKQSAFDAVSSRRFSHKSSILEDNLINSLGLNKVYKELIEQDFFYELESEINFVKQNFPHEIDNFVANIWRNINHYPIEEQKFWLSEYSNFYNVYRKDSLEFIETNVDNLRNEKEIAEKLLPKIKQIIKKYEDDNFIINISLGTNETQVVWYLLGENGHLADNTRFLKTHDQKDEKPENRFKKFSIVEFPVNLLAKIGSEIKLFDDTKSDKRKLAEKKMEAFIQSGFSILLIGERGTGKSKIAKDAKNNIAKHSEFISANCASFEEDSKAEAELFGYKKGAFTGAISDKIGLIEKANNGILFLDEIHHLSKIVQAKLMVAFQTDEHNKMSIRKMGDLKDSKVECRLIFATNKSVPELKKILLPDFYDRVVQHVVHFPPLRETPEDREKDWETVWRSMKFRKTPPKPDSPEILNWLKKLPLYGNFRDLQKIAIYFNIYNEFSAEVRKMIPEKNAFQYAKNEFEKYFSPENIEEEKLNFSERKTTNEMIAEFCYSLQKWAVNHFGGRKKAILHFKELGETISEKTFNDWKNKKRLQHMNK